MDMDMHSTQKQVDRIFVNLRDRALPLAISTKAAIERKLNSGLEPFTSARLVFAPEPITLGIQYEVVCMMRMLFLLIPERVARRVTLLPDLGMNLLRLT
eukprot:960923-Rhodomonas_salina.3